jgi:tripartite-type tricarboxylate transporter receptor subunit TctC
LPNVPLIVDVTDNGEQKAALKLIVARQSVARPFAAPPGIPQDRARALRDAFDATMKDPDFIAEAKGQNLDVDPVSGAEVEALIREVYASSPEAVALATTSMKETRE